MGQPRPSVRRRRVASLLIRHREAADKTPDEAATRIDCYRSKISRMENAWLPISSSELRDLLTFYGVDDPGYVEEVAALNRKGSERGWAQQFDISPPSYVDYIDYEESASHIRSFQPMMVAGLLQTADYARAVYRASPFDIPPERIDELVAVRLQRQKVLDRAEPPQLSVILGEAALRGHVGGLDVLRKQLDHLRQLGNRPNIELQVLPFSAGAHAGIMGSFVLFSFSTTAFSDVACVEHQAGMLYMEKPEETSAFTLTFDSLRSSALSASQSRDLLTRVIREL
ncbi:helix-turn-helix domain-containing protein [Kitasatospora sp. NPDC018058]|uniref:helix-turn-helix domain-containing protein n=1 Tax=Kitasatospora sp. NPDC018058 TaxID=3364025 RepID=UPI0037C18D10